MRAAMWRCSTHKGRIAGSWRRQLVAASLVVLAGALTASCSYQPQPASGAQTPRGPAPALEPRVLAVRPPAVQGRGGVHLVVLGRRFTSATVITIGGVRARVLQVRNPDALVVLSPPGVGTEVVRARNGGRASAVNARSVIQYDSRVLIVGDSLGIDLGWGFTPALDAQDDLSVVDDAVGSTGLVRTDYYDWPANLRSDIRRTDADVVVTMFGTNDQQALSTARGLVFPGTRGWNVLYRARVRQIASIVHDAGATLVWVSLPRMGPQSVLSAQFVKDVVALDDAVIAALPRAAFVNTWRVFTTPAGAYTPYVELAPRLWELGHSPDGTHLTTAGAAVIDVKAAEALRRLLSAH